MDERRPRVLSIEDHEDNQELLRWIFEEWPYDLLCAADAEAGLALLEQGVPAVDLVLMDINLPGMSGDQAIVQLRGDPRFAELPIIALTAHAMDAEQQRIRSSGADAVIAKPLDEDELQAAIERLLARKHGGAT